MPVNSIDHVAIPIEQIDAMKRFYEKFGFYWDATSAPLLYAVTLGTQKINLHAKPLWENPNFTLRAPMARVGCGDFCFVWEGTKHELVETIRELDLSIEEGPVERLGGAGSGESIYVRDPDQNLVEFIVY